MTRVTNTKSKRRWPLGLAVGAILAATLSAGAFPGSAGAEGRRDEGRRDEHRDAGPRGGLTLRSRHLSPTNVANGTHHLKRTWPFL